MDYIKKVCEVLDDMGLYVESSGEINLQEYITDSAQFITFVVKLEEKFDFVFPDEYLLYDTIASMSLLCEIIQSTKNMSK